MLVMFRFFMLKYLQGFFDIVSHGNSDGEFVVVPIKLNAKENSATPINIDARYFSSLY